MSVLATVIDVFEPGQRKASASIRSLIPRQSFDALRERLGSEAADKAEKAHRALLRVDGDLTQFRLDDGHRIRVKLDD